jgi:hypothetical protein
VTNGGDEIAVTNGDEVANELVAIDRPAPTPVRSCSFSGSPDCRFSAPTTEAIPRNATPVTETYFLPPAGAAAVVFSGVHQGPLVGVIGAAPTSAASSPSGCCDTGMAEGTLNPTNPYRTSRIGLARLKKQ